MGNRLKELCKKNKMNQTKLAKELEVSQSCISLWQSGKTRPTAKQMSKLCEIFNCTADYLWGYVDINLKEPESNDNTITVYGRGTGKKVYKVSKKRLEAIQALLDEDSSDDVDF